MHPNNNYKETWWLYYIAFSGPVKKNQKEDNGKTTMKFKRKLDKCHPQDNKIEIKNSRDKFVIVIPD